jgi:hypothetical protein
MYSKAPLQRVAEGSGTRFVVVALVLAVLLDLPAWNIVLAVLIAAAIIALTHGA